MHNVESGLLSFSLSLGFSALHRTAKRPGSNAKHTNGGITRRNKVSGSGRHADYAVASETKSSSPSIF